MNAIDHPTLGQAPPRHAMIRGAATWYAYLLLGFFTFTLTIQGNVLPFLKAELGLSYAAAALHTSAIAVGMILIGLTGDRLARRLGRAPALKVAALAVIAGCIMLAAAPTVVVSLAGCVLIGALGSIIPTIVFALLSDLHGANRTIAYSESNAVSYAFAILAPLSMSACLALALSWRFSVLFGAALGVAIVIGYWRAAVPPSRAARASRAGSLPPAFWIYWGCLGLSVAIEFSVLVWAPTYLEQGVGLRGDQAAAASAAFSLAMLIGRTAGGGLVRRFAVQRLFLVALATTIAGFLLYWLPASPWLVVPGLFVIGLGVALLYPLALGLAVGAAGEHGDAASARVMIAVGLAIMFVPALLGSVADRVGLHAALLILPILVVLAFGFFVAGRMLQGAAR